MNPLKADRLRPVFFLLVVMLMSVAIPNARANPDLIEAIENNDATKVEQLIKDGVDVNKAIDAWIAYGRITNFLYLAVVYGNPEIVKLLVENGANINFEEEGGALHVAAKCGHLEIVRMLIETYGVSILSEYAEQLPLHKAVAANHLKVIEYLLNLAPDTINHGEQTPLIVAFGNLFDIDNQGVIQLLLSHGADPNKNGADLLQLAVSLGNANGLALIFNHPGFNHDLINSIVDGNDNSPLHIACWNKHTTVIQLILKSPEFDHALIDRPNSNGQTPMQLADGNPEIVALLTQYVATLEQVESVLPGTENQQDESESISDDPDLNTPIVQDIDSLSDNTEPDAIVPEETIPGETVPDKTVPDKTVPDKTVPDKTVPDKTVPEEAVPEEAVPEEAVPEEAVPEEAVPEEAVPGKTVPDATVPEEAVPYITISGATEPDETPQLLEDLSLTENTTVIPETLSLINPGMGLMDSLHPTSH